MKSQSLFSGKIKKKYFKMSSTEIYTHSILSVKEEDLVIILGIICLIFS